MKKNYIDYEKTDVHHKKLCKYCKKPLRRFKRNSYGSNRRDWAKRDLHLKCWKKKREIIFL